MSRHLACLGLAVLGLALLCCPAARAADDPDDPVIQMKRLSEWIGKLHEFRDAKPADEKDRQKFVTGRTFILEVVLSVAGPKTPGVLAEIYKTLKEDPDEEVRGAAARWLGDNARAAKDADLDPKPAITALATALKADKAASVREASATALEKMHQVRPDLRDAVAALTDAVKDPSEEVRAAAVRTLTQLGLDALPAVPSMIDLVKDKKAGRFSRGNAALALVRIAPTDDKVLPALVEVLGDKEAPKGVLVDAARAVGVLKREGADAVEALGALLSDSDTDVRRAAATTLGLIGQPARRVLPALQKAVKDPDKEVRGQAIHTIGKLGKDAAEAVKVLAEAVTADKNTEVRLAAIQALAEMGDAAKDALPALMNATNDPKKDVREAAQEAVKKIQGS
jgi:HEAT repeat protein